MLLTPLRAADILRITQASCRFRAIRSRQPSGLDWEKHAYMRTSALSWRPFHGSLLSTLRRSRNRAVSGTAEGCSRPLVDRALGLSIIDGVLFALMVGASESYFGACAVALGHTDTALAMLATLPLVAGALGQALTGPLVLWAGSRKRVVVLGAF